MTPVGDDYALVGGVPLSTPAWITEDLTGLYGGASYRGEGTAVAYHHGEQPPMRWREPRDVSIPMVVLASKDPDGNPHANARLGRAENVDALLLALSNPLSGDGTLEVQHVLTGRTTRSSRCQVRSVRLGKLAPAGMRAVVDLWLPDAVMFDVDPTEATDSGSAPFDLAIPNAGSDQFDVQITLSGAATSVQIVSPAFGGQSLTFDDELGGGVTIQTGRQTAVRDGSDVHGLVDASGMGRWLVVPAGGDTWTVTPSGGSVTVDVEHRAAWA